MIRPNIETDALYLFDMVMRTRSLTKAAEACGMSVGEREPRALETAPLLPG